ncbi:hypothetical protein BDZ89DRAFT_1157003 [Hymenopellis radicata]|nr:hypothetical protein BDZ89DRAFT_1157003 [Hymenopellis radicata]
MSSPHQHLDTKSPDAMDTAEKLPTSLFTEAEHAQLDTLVNRQLAEGIAKGDAGPAEMAPLRPTSNLGRTAAAQVLGVVVAHSEGRLRWDFRLTGSLDEFPDFPPSELKSLLNNSPDLVSAILSAATTGTFKAIREDYDVLHEKQQRRNLRPIQAQIL